MIEITIPNESLYKKLEKNINNIKEIILSILNKGAASVNMYYNNERKEFTSLLIPGESELVTTFKKEFKYLTDEEQSNEIITKFTETYQKSSDKLLSGNIDIYDIQNGLFLAEIAPTNIIKKTLLKLVNINVENHNKLYEINVDINNHIENLLYKYYKEDNYSELVFLYYFNYRRVFGDILTDPFFEKLLSIEFIDKLGISDSLILSRMCVNSNVEFPESIEDYLNNKLVFAY